MRITAYNTPRRAKMRFADRLAAASSANHSRLCVGLDPVMERIPSQDVLTWAKAIIAATSDLVCCYKPNSAFFESLGRHGWEVLIDTIAAVPTAIPVLLDAKRGDIGNTAEAYARAVFDVLGAGAVTANPYLGGDTLEPFLKYEDRAIFVLCRTSNSGAGEFQDQSICGDGAGGRPLYEVVAERSRVWNRNGNVGLVTGATFPQEIGRVRAICPDQMLLVPGVGTQGGEMEAAVHAAADSRGGNFLINASRQVIYASSGPDFASAARAAAVTLREQIEAALLTRETRA
jgi:orotidine-5'-phosphate decarboxylase